MNPDKLCEAIKHYCHIDIKKEIAFDGNIMSDYGVYNWNYLLMDCKDGLPEYTRLRIDSRLLVGELEARFVKYLQENIKDSVFIVNHYGNTIFLTIIGGEWANASVIMEEKQLAEKLVESFKQTLVR